MNIIIKKTSTFLRTAVLLGLTVIVLLNSCKKSSEQDSISKQYLTRFVQFTTSWPIGVDTVWTLDYSYDASKRLTRIVSRYFSGPGALSFTETQNRYYQGTDLLPFKLETQFLTTAGVDQRYIHLLSYDANGTIIKDSVELYVPPNPTRYLHAIYFTRSANNITAIKKSTRTPDGYITVDSIFTIENMINGNLLSKTDTTTYYFPMATTVAVNKYEATTYDTKNNPFRSTLLNYPYNYYGLSSASSSGTFSRSVNNPTHITTKLPNGFISTVDINYFYNSTGYPDSASHYSSGTLYGKTEYFYSSL